jgi:hypothetical protein
MAEQNLSLWYADYIAEGVALITNACGQSVASALGASSWIAALSWYGPVAPRAGGDRANSKPPETALPPCPSRPPNRRQVSPLPPSGTPGRWSARGVPGSVGTELGQ